MNLLPSQLLESILQPTLSVLYTSVPSHIQSLTPTLFPKRSSTHQTWLPSLACFLPHSWVDLEFVTDKAVKRDDAEVPTSLWDTRITLLFPGSSRALGFMRQWLLNKQRRLLTAELRSYLSFTFGFSWCSQLIHHRQQLYLDRFQQDQGGLKHVLNHDDLSM